MEKTQVTLSVFHDGQFFTALFERHDADGFSVARRHFGSKPSDNDVLDLIGKDYYGLRFSRPAADGKETGALAANPKRRQREAAKAACAVCFSTKAQAALKAQFEESKTAAKSVRKAHKERLGEEKIARKQQKRKQKHRGR